MKIDYKKLYYDLLKELLKVHELNIRLENDLKNMQCKIDKVGKKQFKKTGRVNRVDDIECMSWTWS